MSLYTSSYTVRSAAAATKDMGWGKGGGGDHGEGPFIAVPGHLPIDAAETVLGRLRRHHGAVQGPGVSQVWVRRDVWLREVRVRELGSAHGVAPVPPALLLIGISLCRHGAPR